ncbi:adenylate/guanylate cyclase domain-containing protein [Nocardia miyunensis]|uniref:adenylate/guanylate cyclase domain-containing protein n=1 Tax=Nocardia miyunensis TaxID=282684 RepID=UPI000A9B03C2|nr:adenylate/guanylate cyclase domain-containing protein [Nocardia miyunensis]
MMNRLILWALRMRWGLSTVVLACHVGGLAVILIELWLSGLLGRLGPDWMSALAQTAIYPILGALVGGVIAVRDRNHYFGWLDTGRKPTEVEARRLLNLPMATTLRALAIWLPGVVIVTLLFAQVVPSRAIVVVGAMFAFGAFESAGFTLLIVDRLIRPAIPLVATVLGGTMHWSSTVLNRVVLSWTVSGAMPLLMLITVLADPVAAPSDRIHTALYMSSVGLLVGAIATATLARAVAAPLRMLRRALDRIAHGDLEVRVPVGSASEIGRLEHSVNELAENLSERERLRDVFGRHVGAEVAERALAGGMNLTGDVRVVTALFVDVVGSVELSTELAPREFVAKLNRLLSIVVEATEDNGGLVNKFEGDAALCIFGAPIALRDNATPALRAARRIRDEVAAGGELDIGIGVARGSVFAGDVGADTRLEFTVIGDAVNEASRLTTEAKHVPRRILVSQNVIEAASGNESASWELHDTIHLRGRKQPTDCWTDIAAPATGVDPDKTAAPGNNGAGPASDGAVAPASDPALEAVRPE